MEIVVFVVGDTAYGVPVEAVEEILPAVAAARLPNAPAVVQGYMQLRGTIIPIVDFRRRFGLVPKQPAIADHMIVIRYDGERYTFYVDRVTALVAAPREDYVTAATDGGSELVSGVVRGPEGLILIHDPRRFLKDWEAEAVAAAILPLEEESRGAK